jgi:hypothetical protein
LRHAKDAESWGVMSAAVMARPERLRTAAAAQEYAVRVRRLQVLAARVPPWVAGYEQADGTNLLVEQAYADGLVTNYLRRRERGRPWGPLSGEVVWALHPVGRFTSDTFMKGAVDENTAVAEVSVLEGRVLAAEGGYVLREVVPHKLMSHVEILSPVEGADVDSLAAALMVWTASEMLMQGTFRDIVDAAVSASTM